MKKSPPPSRAAEIERELRPLKKHLRILGFESHLVLPKPSTPPPAALLRQLQNRYVRVVKIGDRWNTYLQIDHQGFCVVEQTSHQRARWFGKMLAIAIAVLREDGLAQTARSPGCEVRGPHRK